MNRLVSQPCRPPFVLQQLLDLLPSTRLPVCPPRMYPFLKSTWHRERFLERVAPLSIGLTIQPFQLKVSLFRLRILLIPSSSWPAWIGTFRPRIKFVAATFTTASSESILSRTFRHSFFPSPTSSIWSPSTNIILLPPL